MGFFGFEPNDHSGVKDDLPASMKYFIDPDLRKEVVSMRDAIQSGLLDKDDFLRYIYGRFDGELARLRYVDKISSEIKLTAEIIKNSFNTVSHKQDFDINFWDNNNPKGVIKYEETNNKATKSLTEKIVNIRNATVKEAISGMWSDGLSYRIEINRDHKKIYSNLVIALLILASYDRRIESSVMNLINVRHMLFEMTRGVSFFDKLNNYSKWRYYDKSVIMIDRVIYDYNNFKASSEVIENHFLSKI